MSKNQKKTAKKAAKIPSAPAVEEKKTEQKPVNEEKKEEKKSEAKVEVPAEQHQESVEMSISEKIASAEQAGMDPNHRIDNMRMLYSYFHENNGDAARKFGVSDETIQKMDHYVFLANCAEAAIEMQCSKTPFALVMSKAMAGEMAEAFSELNINVGTKFLEAKPDKDGNVTLSSSDVKVSREAKTAIAKTVEARKKVVITDPTKIENDDQLKESLTHMLASNTFFKDFKATLNFYRSVRQLQNKKAGNDTKAAAYKDMPFDKLIKEIEDLIIDCPFIVGGYGSALYRMLVDSKSIVYPFSSLYLNSKNTKVGDPTLTESEVVSITRALINWKIDHEIANKQKSLDVLNKDKKANKAAIAKKEAEIAEIEGYRTLLLEPTAEFADKLLENRKDKDPKVSLPARRAYDNIRRAYYPETNRGNGKKFANIDENVQQRAGIIINMFRDPTVPLSNYNIGNLTDLVEVEDNPESNTKKEDNASKKEQSADKSGKK